MYPESTAVPMSIEQARDVALQVSPLPYIAHEALQVLVARLDAVERDLARLTDTAVTASA